MSTALEKGQRNALDVVFTLAMFALFLLVEILSLSLSAIAGGVPKLIAAIGMLFCLVSLAVKPKVKAPLATVREVSGQDAPELIQSAGMPIWEITTIILAYFAAMLSLGFVTASLAMFILLPMAMRQKFSWKIVLFSVITTAILYLSFAKLFYVRLPSGFLLDLIFKAG